MSSRFALLLCGLVAACGDDGGAGPGPGSGTITGTCDPASTATTSFDRIDEALANGLLDLETSIEMKAFAEFSDTRLTAECRGDDTDVFEADSLDLISENWDTLSPDARAILGPFTWPPVYVGSWASPAPRAKRTLELCDFPELDPNWDFLPIAGGSFKVWYNSLVPGSGAKAMTVLSALENDIAPKDASIGMKTPLDDTANTGCNGGDGRLDVFLVSMATYGKTASDFGETKPVMKGAAQQRPTYILLNNTKSDTELKHSAAHEYFHAIQWAYPLAGAGLRESYDWLKDATAEWNADWIYPTDGQSQIKSPSYTTKVDVTSLDQHGESNHVLGTYLFFKFLSKTYDPTLIRQIWEKAAMETDERLVVDKTIDGGFKKQWPLFAKLLWNQDPVAGTAMNTFDMLKDIPPIAMNGAVLTSDSTTGAGLFSFNVPQPHLSIRYYNILIAGGDQSVRSVAFSSPSTRVGVQAFEMINGDSLANSVWRDWNDVTVRPNQQAVHYCNDITSQRLTQLVVIVTNDSPTNDNDTLPDLEIPRLTFSSVGCWQYQGTTSIRDQSANLDQVVTSTVTLQVDPSPVWTNDYFIHYMVLSGTANIDSQGDDGAGCHSTNTGTGPLTVGEAGGVVDINLGLDYGVPLPNKRLVTSLEGVANLDTTFTTSGTCGNFTNTNVQQWTWFHSPAQQILVNPAGSFSTSVTEGTTTYQYDFNPMRQP